MGMSIRILTLILALTGCASTSTSYHVAAELTPAFAVAQRFLAESVPCHAFVLVDGRPDVHIEFTRITAHDAEDIPWPLDKIDGLFNGTDILISDISEPIEWSRIVTHEMLHSAGVPHSSSAASLMSGAAATPCLSEEDVQVIAQTLGCAVPRACVPRE